MSCSSNLASGYLLERCGSTWRRDRQAGHVAISAGPPSCVTTLKRFWRVISLLLSQ